MRNTKSLVAVVTWSLASIAVADAPCSLVEIDRLGAEGAYVAGLNNWGQVVGSLVSTQEGEPSQSWPFVWYNGHTRVLESPTPSSEPRAINAFGRVVGRLYEADGKVVPVTWAHGRIARLSSEQQAVAVDVNNRGQIIGYNASSRGVLWQNAGSAPIDLGTLGGGMCEPAALNDHGVIVGVSAVEGNVLHAFVWEDGVFTDVGLPEHPDASIEIVRTRLEAINDDGLAAGFAYASDGTSYPLLWTRAGGARVLSTPVQTTAAVTAWGTVAMLSTDGELLLGGYTRPFRNRGSFDELGEVYRVDLNDRYQLAFSARRDGEFAPFFCQLGS
jgi:probable HAF family extracellular repeat protein